MRDRTKPRVAKCKTCGIGITAAAKTGYCKACSAKQSWAKPGHRERHAAGIRNKIASDPLYHAAMKERGRVFGLKMGQDEALRERRKAVSSKTAREVLHRPDVRAKTLEAVRTKTGKTQSAQRRAWCPEGYWEQYRHLTKTKKLPFAEARKIVLDTAARDKAKADASLSPFERQQRALERGAKLVEMPAGATLARPGVYRA